MTALQSVCHQAYVSGYYFHNYFYINFFSFSVSQFSHRMTAQIKKFFLSKSDHSILIINKTLTLAVLKSVRHCRKLVSDPGATRLILFLLTRIKNNVHHIQRYFQYEIQYTILDSVHGFPDCFSKNHHETTLSVSRAK